MEKCTFCVQRIKAAEIQAEAEKRELKDGEFTTACAQSCASKALVFGDLNDPNSEVSRLSQLQSRHQTAGRTRHQAERDLSPTRHLGRCKERLNKSSRICCGRSSRAARSIGLPWRSRPAWCSRASAAFGYQLYTGIGVWGMNSPVFWAFDITNFVFWIGISHAGTLISAILRLCQCHLAPPGHALR